MVPSLGLNLDWIRCVLPEKTPSHRTLVLWDGPRKPAASAEQTLLRMRRKPTSQSDVMHRSPSSRTVILILILWADWLTSCTHAHGGLYACVLAKLQTFGMEKLPYSTGSLLTSLDVNIEHVLFVCVLLRKKMFVVNQVNGVFQGGSTNIQLIYMM